VKQAERLAAESAAERLGLPVATTAADAMQDGLDRANGIIVWLVAQLQALDPADLTWGAAQRRIRPGQGGEAPMVEVTQTSRVHPLFGMYERTEARLARIAVEMARLGIEQRHQAVLEREGAAIFAVLDATLAEYRRVFQLTAEQHAQGQAIIRRHLLAIEGGE